MNSVKVLIVGAGKIGYGLASKISVECYQVGLLDKNLARLKYCSDHLLNGKAKIQLHESSSNEFTESIDSLMERYHFVVCTTSNVDYILNDRSKYKNCVVIDDSRPEAFHRVFLPDANAVVLEGGIIKIGNIFMNSNFGFGMRRNVFGCLAEAVILASDRSESLQPSIGDLNTEILNKYIDFISKNNLSISIGDWMTGNLVHGDEQISSIMRNKICEGVHIGAA